MDQTGRETLLRGILPVLPTPFAAAVGIESRAMGRIVDFAIRAGVDGVVFPGFASEVDELTAQERATAAAGRGRPRRRPRAGRRRRERRSVGEAVEPCSRRSLVARRRHGHDPGAEERRRRRRTRSRPSTATIAEAVPGIEIVLQNAPAPRGSDLDAADHPRHRARQSARSPTSRRRRCPPGRAISAILASRPAHLLGVIGGGGARYIVDEYNRGACGAMPAVELADVHVALDRAYRARRHRDGARPLHAHAAAARDPGASTACASPSMCWRAAASSTTPACAPSCRRSTTHDIAEIDAWLARRSVCCRDRRRTRRRPAHERARREASKSSRSRCRATRPISARCAPGEELNAKGYFVRKGNRTVYPTFDRTVVVRIETDGRRRRLGRDLRHRRAAARRWRSSTICSADFVVGRDPRDAAVDPRGSLRPDARARLYRRLLPRRARGGRHRALGHCRKARRPAAGQAARRAAARAHPRLCLRPAEADACRARRLSPQHWQSKGFDSFKFGGPVADDGVVAEIANLRERARATRRASPATCTGPTPPRRRSRSIRRDGAARPLVRRGAGASRRTSTAWPASPRASRRRSRRARNGAPCSTLVPRIARRACGILQPEMGHTGVTEFMRIGHLCAGASPARHSARDDRHRHLPGREPAGERGALGGDCARIPALDLRAEPAPARRRHGLPRRRLRAADRPGPRRRTVRGGPAPPPTINLETPDTEDIHASARDLCDRPRPGRHRRGSRLARAVRCRRWRRTRR